MKTTILLGVTKTGHLLFSEFATATQPLAPYFYVCFYTKDPVSNRILSCDEGFEPVEKEEMEEYTDLNLYNKIYALRDKFHMKVLTGSEDIKEVEDIQHEAEKLNEKLKSDYKAIRNHAVTIFMENKKHCI